MQGAGEGEIEEDPQPQLGCLGSGGWWPPGGGDRSGAAWGTGWMRSMLTPTVLRMMGTWVEGGVSGWPFGVGILCVGGSGQVILKLDCTIIVSEKGLGSLGILLAEAEIVTDGFGAR